MALDRVVDGLDGDDGADHGDAQRAAHLAHGGVGAAGHTRLVRWDVAEDHVGQLGHREAGAQPVADQAGQEMAEGEVGADDHGHVRQAQGLHDQPESDHRDGADAAGEASRDGGADDDGQAVGQDPQAVLQSRQVLALLEEQGQGEAQPELAHGQHGRGQQPVAEGAVAEHPELEQRTGVAALAGALVAVEGVEDPGRGRQDHRDDRDGGVTRPQLMTGRVDRGDRGDPAVGATLAQREHEQEHADRDEGRARPVERLAPPRPLGRGDEEHGPEDGHRSEDHVDAERPAPREVGGEQTTDHGAEPSCRSGHRTPGGEGHGPPASLEGVGQQGQRGRQHQRRAEPFDDGLTHHQAGHVPRQGCEQRAASEQRGSGHEDTSLAVDVAQAPADDQEGGEGQGVAGDHPFEAGQRGVELAKDGGDGHVEDRGVEHHDHRRHQDDAQRDPLADRRLVVARAGPRTGG